MCFERSRALARCAGLRRRCVAYPGLADSPWATCCRPLRGLAVPTCCIPRARGLALGYMLSPAARARGADVLRTQGSRTRPGLHAVARCAGSRRRCVAYPGLADSPWATCCRPLRGLATPMCCIPRARGLVLGYMLSPAAWASGHNRIAYRIPDTARAPGIGVPFLSQSNLAANNYLISIPNITL